MTINDVCQIAKMLQKILKEGFGNIVYKNTKYRFFVACSNHQHNNDVCQISETSEKHVKECYVNWYQKDVLVYTNHILVSVRIKQQTFYSGRVNWIIQGF